MKKLIFPVALLAMVVAASCNKDKVAVTPTDQKESGGGMVKMAGNGGMSSLELYQGGDGPMRKVNKKVTDCITEKGDCAPKDIVIQGVQLATLDAAILQGALSVAELFSNDETARIYFPNWDEDWFADVKSALKSGLYTFEKTGTSMYLLGKTGTVITENHEYAVKYDVR